MARTKKAKPPAVCDERTDLPFPVRLLQSGPDDFTVEYGKQVKRGLTYGAAAREYGSCIMHALTLADRLDNSEAS